MFFGGNTPLLQINTGNDVLLPCDIRESYTDSLPLSCWKTIQYRYMDLRYYKQSLAEYISERSPDMVLVCYSVSNFMTDTNIFLVARIKNKLKGRCLCSGPFCFFIFYFFFWIFILKALKEFSTAASALQRLQIRQTRVWQYRLRPSKY
jgi:hypothetical protein